jgi:hypothetical protein
MHGNDKETPFKVVFYLKKNALRETEMLRLLCQYLSPFFSFFMCQVHAFWEK